MSGDAHNAPEPGRFGIKDQAPETWWRDFFGEDYLLMYGAELTPQCSGREAECAVRALGLRKGSRLLDVCCGFGRHLPWFARHGLRPVGLEWSTYQLSLARSMFPENKPLPLARGDARTLPFGPVFDAACLMYTAMGYFDDEQNARQIAEVARALKPGGQVYIDNQNPPFILSRMRPERRVEDAAGRLTIIEQFEYDADSRRTYGRKTIRSPQGEREHYFVLRAYWPEEVKRLLADAGFQVESTCGDYDGRPYSDDTPRLILTARKQ